MLPARAQVPYYLDGIPQLAAPNEFGGNIIYPEEFGWLPASDPSSNPAINAKALQSAFEAVFKAGGGTVAALTGGVFYVNATSFIYSNTTFLRGDGVEIRAYGTGTTPTFPLIINKNADSVPVSISTMTSVKFGTADRVRTTVTFAAPHGLAAGDWVQIKGDAKRIYNDIWQVETAPSATVITFLHTVASGTIAPPDAAISVASASQTVATPGVFTTATNSFVAEQAVQITGTPPGGFANGVTYYVISNGLTNTTCQLADSPFATTGKQVTSSSACTLVPVYIGAKADANISLIGGKNNSNFDPTLFAVQTTWADHGMILRRVLRPYIERVDTMNARKYGIMMQDVFWPIIKDIQPMMLNTASDCVHIYGPCCNPSVENVGGISGDDGVVFQTIDGSVYLPYMMGTGFDRGGDFYNGSMRNIRFRHSRNSAGAMLYPNGNHGGAGGTAEIYRMRGHYLIECAAQLEKAVVAGWGPGNTVAIGSIYTTVSGKIESVNLRNTGWPLLPLNSGTGAVVSIENLVIDNPQNDLSTGSDLQFVLDYLSVNQFVVNNANLLNTNTNTLIRLNSANAVISDLIFNGGRFNQKGSGNFSLIGANNGSLGRITLNEVTLGANTRAVTESHGNFSGTPQLVVNGGRGLSAYASLLTATSSQNWDIKLRDFQSINPTTGLFNLYGTPGTINIWASGLQTSGIIFANLNGTVSMYNPDGTLPVDLLKLTRTAGQMAKSTGNGTIVANNMAVCDATGAANSWKQLSNTTLTF